MSTRKNSNTRKKTEPSISNFKQLFIRQRKKKPFLIWDFETVSILIVRLCYASKVCVDACVKKKKIKQLQISSQFSKKKKRKKMDSISVLFASHLRQRTDTMLTASYNLFILSLFFSLYLSLCHPYSVCEAHVCHLCVHKSSYFHIQHFYMLYATCKTFQL